MNSKLQPLFNGFAGRLGLLALMLAGLPDLISAAPLTTLEYRITGSSLAVAPTVLSVPKGIAGSVAVQFTGDPALAQGAFVSATLRGPISAKDGKLCDSTQAAAILCALTPRSAASFSARRRRSALLALPKQVSGRVSSGKRLRNSSGRK